MPGILVLDRALAVLRIAVFAVAAASFVLFTIDWLVRTRRINPFGSMARRVRRLSDPLVLPIERRVVRAGGLPSSAPWWALVAVVVGGILLLTVLEFLSGQLSTAIIAAERGGRGVYRLVVVWSIGILQIALLIRVIASWLRLGEYRPWIRWTVILTEWFLRPLRRVIPPLGMVDISPLVAYVLLIIVRVVLLGFA